MNRRAILQSVAVAVAAPFATADTPARHWLDEWSSEDIEATLRTLGVWPAFTRERNRRNRVTARMRRQEQRAQNVVVWRGRLAESLPDLVWRTVPADRRDVRIVTVEEPLALHGYEIPRGARVLVDSRVRDSVIGARAEIIDTPTGRRVHIWPTPENADAGATLADAWPADVHGLRLPRSRLHRAIEHAYPRGYP